MCQVKLLLRCVYDIDHMYALQIQDTSESDPCSYEAANKAPPPKKNSEASKAAIGNSIPRGEYFKPCLLFDMLMK